MRKVCFNICFSACLSLYLLFVPIGVCFAQNPQTSNADGHSGETDNASHDSLAENPKAAVDPFAKESFGKQPTYIKSNSLVLRSKDRVFVYSGDVEVRQGDMTLTSETLEGKYDQNNDIQELVAFNNVVIVKGENIRANGNRAIYRKENETVTLTENPEMQQEGSVLTADAITIFLNENRSQAEGNVRVKLVQDTKAKPGKKGASIKDLT